MHAAQERLLSGSEWAGVENSGTRSFLKSISLRSEDVSAYSGFEVDVMWDSVARTLIVSHDVEKTVNGIRVFQNQKLSLDVFLSEMKRSFPDKMNFWFDFKNRDLLSAQQSLTLWGDLFDRYHLRHTSHIESRNFEIVRLLMSEGFKALWWLESLFNFRDAFFPRNEMRLLSVIKFPKRLTFNTRRIYRELLQRARICYGGIRNVSLPYEGYSYLEGGYRSLNMYIWFSLGTPIEIPQRVQRLGQFPVILQ